MRPLHEPEIPICEAERATGASGIAPQGTLLDQQRIGRPLFGSVPACFARERRVSRRRAHISACPGGGLDRQRCPRHVRSARLWTLVLGDEIAPYERPALEHVAARPADTPLVERRRTLHGGLRVARSHGAAQTDGVTARQLNAANVGVVACEESRRLQISLSLDGPHGLAPERDRQLSPSRGSDHWRSHGPFAGSAPLTERLDSVMTPGSPLWMLRALPGWTWLAGNVLGSRRESGLPHWVR